MNLIIVNIVPSAGEGDEMGYKIQTGLRVPEEVHDQLQKKADEMGVSVNQLILVLINIGLKFMEKGIIPQD